MPDLLHSLFAFFQETGHPWYSAEIKHKSSFHTDDGKNAYSFLSRATCPFTSLPVTNRPEWKNIPVGGDYTVSFFLLGSRIVCAIPLGVPTPEGMIGLLKARDRVLKETRLATKKRVEIRDFRGLISRPSKEVRMIQANQLLKDLAEGYLIGFYIANAPLYVKWMYQVGSVLHKPSVPVVMVGTFEEAVRKALQELTGQGIDPDEIREDPNGGGSRVRFRSIRTRQRANRASASHDKDRASAGRLYTEEKIQGYVDDLIGYIGAINWDQDGLCLDGFEEVHPFRPVFDALALIKTDLDDLQEQRRKSQLSLQESEQRYRTILESIEEGYFELDLNGNICFFNGALCSILGYCKEELRGLSSRNLMDPETSGRVFEVLRRVQESGAPQKGVEYRIIRKDGGRRHVEVSISPVKDSENRVIGFRGMARDITERKTVELELERHRHHLEEMVDTRTRDLMRVNEEMEQEIGERKKVEEKLRAASEAKSQFVAKVSHEIRTPLNGIIGIAELCLDTSPTEEQSGLLQTLNKEASSLLGIINDVLDFSKIEAGKLDLEEIPFDLRNTFEDIAKAFVHSASQKGLDLITYLNPDVPFQLLGDPGKLRQILRNLLENAVKFTEAGSILLKGELAREFPEKVEIRFMVRDTGIGIPREKQAAVFESFTQADNSTTRKYGGTGLGVTIASQIAEKMGGKMVLESEDGKGSTFQFTALFGKIRCPPAPVREKPVEIRGLKILTLLDNGPTRQSGQSGLGEILRSWGCRLSETRNPEEVLGLLTHALSTGSPFDLLIVSSGTSLEGGFRLSARIRETRGVEGLPMVLITPFGKSGDGRMCREIGVNGYLAKSITAEDLRRIIEAVLNDSRKGAESGPFDLVTRHTLAEQDRRKMRILLVEDYPTNRQVALKHLENLGYRVDVAENGSMAVRAFKEKRYDLIFMDLQMPEMDGYQATRAIREFEKEMWGQGLRDDLSRPAGVPIIAITAHAVKGYYEACIQAGMDDYLTKPFRKKDLLGKLEKWLRPQEEQCPADPKVEPAPVPVPKPLETEGSSQIAPVDMERAVKEFEGDREGLMEIAEAFIRNVADQVKIMREAVASRDGERIRKEAHSIKGGAANLTALPLSAIAGRLERMCKNGIPDEQTAKALNDLQVELRRLEGYMKQEQERLRA